MSAPEIYPTNQQLTDEAREAGKVRGYFAASFGRNKGERKPKREQQATRTRLLKAVAVCDRSSQRLRTRGWRTWVKGARARRQGMVEGGKVIFRNQFQI